MKDKLRVRIWCHVIMTFTEFSTPLQEIRNLFLDLSSKQNCLDDVQAYLDITQGSRVAELTKVSIAIHNADKVLPQYVGRWFASSNGKIYLTRLGTIKK